MTLFTYKGEWTSRSTVGTDVITGVGFTPSVIIVYASQAAANATFEERYARSFGVAIGTTASTDQKSIYAFSTDNSASSNVSSMYAQSVITIINSSGTTIAEATVSAIGADGFTINWTTIDIARIFHFYCLGGTDITDTAVGSFDLPTSGTTGNVSTNIGMQPDLLFLFSRGAGAENSASTGSCGLSVGVASTTGQFAIGHTTVDGAATMDTGRTQRADRVILRVNFSDATLIEAEASFVSFSATGFTLNYTSVDVGASTDVMGYLAIKGVTTIIDSFTTAGATQTVATGGFIPAGVMLFSVNGASSTAVQTNNRYTMGAIDDAVNGHAIWGGDQDNVADSITAVYQDNTNCYFSATEAATATSSTKNTVASCTGLSSSGFALSYSVGPATEEVCFIAFYAVDSQGGGGPPPAIAAIQNTMGEYGMSSPSYRDFGQV
jgi:hypothetical protein